VSSRAGFPSVLATVDAALEELGESLPRSNRLPRILPWAMDDTSDTASQAMMGIAAASMAMSMAWERVILAGQGRSDARRVPRLVLVGLEDSAHPTG
jgi:hypothetical protein